MTDNAETTPTPTLTHTPYPAYKDSGVDWLGKIPAHWECVRMKRLFSDVSVKNKPNAELLSVTQNQGVVPRTWVENRMVMPSGNLESFKFIRKGDFAISLRSFEGGLEFCHHDGIVSPAYTVLHSSRANHALFYKHLFKSQTFISELQTSIIGIREGKNISYEELCYSFLPVPPLAEQIRIAEFLDRKTAQIDQAIAQKERLIGLLNERRQVMIHRAVTRGLNPDALMKDSGIEWIGEIPAHWSICALGYVAKISTGATPDRSRPDYWNGSIPWVKTGEINYSLITATEECISRSGLKNSSTRLSPIGTILMAMYGQGVTRGRVGILGVSAAYNQACAAIQVDERLFNQYAYYFFVSAYPFIRDAGNETSQMNLSSGYIAKVKITIPVREEQNKIVAYCQKKKSEFEEIIKLQTNTIQKLQELKSTLINSAVTGKIKV